MITFSDAPPGEPITVSATLYLTYRKCPQQALARLRGIYPPDSVASFRGLLAHRLFARHLVDGPIPEAEFTQACREEIGAPESHLNRKLAPLDLTKPSQLAPVLAEVGELYDRFRRLPSDGFRAAEVSLRVVIGDGVTLRGRVDAVFEGPAGGPLIIDWKTGVALDGVGPQLEFYALIWALDRDRLPWRVEAVSIRTGERVETETTSDRIRATADDVTSMVGRLRSALRGGGDLERHAGPACRWCPLLESCAEGTAAVAVLSGG